MRNKIIVLLFILIFSLISCSGEEVSSDSDTEVKEYNHHVSNFSVSGEKLSIFDPASEIDSTQGKKSPKINYLLESQNLYVNYPDERPTIFLFVAHWCPYCQNEIPVVKNWIQNEQLFEQGVNIVLVVTNINPDKSNYPPDLWLNREEWEAIEVPVSPGEKIILSIIKDGYENVNIKRNDALSLILKFTIL